MTSREQVLPGTEASFLDFHQVHQTAIANIYVLTVKGIDIHIALGKGICLEHISLAHLREKLPLAVSRVARGCITNPQLPLQHLPPHLRPCQSSYSIIPTTNNQRCHQQLSTQALILTQPHEQNSQSTISTDNAQPSAHPASPTSSKSTRHLSVSWTHTQQWIRTVIRHIILQLRRRIKCILCRKFFPPGHLLFRADLE